MKKPALFYWRKLHNLTQHELARKAHISTHSIVRYENRGKLWNKLDALKLSKFFSIELNEVGHLPYPSDEQMATVQAKGPSVGRPASVPDHMVAPNTTLG